MEGKASIQGIELSEAIKGKAIKLIEEIDESLLPKGFITEITYFDPDDGSINVVTTDGDELWIFNDDLWRVEWAEQPKQPKQPSRKKLKSVAEDLIQQFEYTELSRKNYEEELESFKSIRKTAEEIGLDVEETSEGLNVTYQPPLIKY